MATDGPTPPACDPEVFQHGEPIILLSGSSNMVENWVRGVAVSADARLDWHYSGGVAQVLHLGDETSWDRTQLAIDSQIGDFRSAGGSVVRQIKEKGQHGIYRSGVDDAPAGAIAVVTTSGHDSFL